MASLSRPAETTRVPAVSRPLLRLFHRIVRRRLRAGFHAVRVEGLHHLSALRTAPPDMPIIVLMNHSSWWDPMLSYLLSQQLPKQLHFAPMDAAAFTRYRILGRLGVFPVDLQSARGGVQFVRTASAILAAGGVLWITPQGRFVDVRERPLVLKPGLPALLARLPRALCVPLALEYSFWDERTPEALALVGEPLLLEQPDAAAAELALREALEHAMDQLSARVQRRHPHDFSTVLLHGTAGTGGFYALGQRLRALLTGKRYQREHTALPSGEADA